MLTRKSGILALILGVSVFGAACEEKDDGGVITPPPPAEVVVNIVPETVAPVTAGTTVTLFANVTGSTNQAVTWSSSNTTVADVNQSGVVTTKAAGTTTIRAVSQADNTKSDAVSITVNPTTGGGTGGGQPSISIASVTNFATTIPVNPGNVAGVVDVTMNVDIPAGVNAAAVRVTLNGVEVCRQTFTTGGAVSEEASASAVPVTIICSINTAATDANGVPLFLNGQLTGNNSIRAEVLSPTNEVLASATFQPIILNNADVVTATLTTSKGPVIQNGLAWRGGDVTVTLVPTIFTGAANQPTALTVTLTSSGAGVIEGDASGCSTIVAGGCGIDTETGTDATAGDGFSVTFDDASTFGTAAGTPGVGRIEDPNVTVTIGGLVASGNPYVGGFVVNMAGAPLSPATANILRLDNLAPRVTLLDITTATLGCASPSTNACYINDDFTFTSTNQNAATQSTLARTVDLGVDAQTTTFQAGTAAGSLTTVENGGQLPESQVASTYLLAATTTDALQNSRTVFATDVATCVSGSSTSVTAANLQPQAGSCAGVTAVQRFGVDITPPTLTVTAGPPNNGANDGTVYTFSFNDVGSSPTAGPSGFSANPVSIRVERVLATGTTCFGDAGAANANCSFVADDGTVTLPAGEAYFRTTAFVTDQAGNTSAEIVRMTLIDVTAPVVGGIVAPSTITGGQNITLTASASDNVELGDVQAAIQYGAVATLGFDRRALATYGPTPDLVNSTTIQYQLDNFIHSIETTTAAGRPTGVITLADQAEFDVRDMAGVVDNVACPPNAASFCDVTTQSLVANVAAQNTSWSTSNPTFASANAAHGNFVQLAPNPATVCNGATGAACAAGTSTSTTLRATATGPNTTFANPFARVLFFYIDAAGRAQLIGTATPSASDNTITATRTWTYSATFTPNGFAPAGYQTFALGVDTQGRALMTNTQVVNVTDTGL